MYLQMRAHCEKVLEQLKYQFQDNSYITELLNNPQDKIISNNRPIIWDNIFEHQESFDILDQFYIEILRELHKESLGKYTISINYKTGDSFNTYDREDEIPLVFTSLSEVNAFIAILLEHYFYHQITSSCLLRGENRQNFVDMIESRSWYNKQYNFCFIYNNQNVHAFWVGYFEDLEEITVFDKNQNIVNHQYISLVENPFRNWIN